MDKEKPMEGFTTWSGFVEENKRFFNHVKGAWTDEKEFANEIYSRSAWNYE